jgi:hypothetical protein
MKSSKFRLSVALLVLLSCAAASFAQPVAYSFTTSQAPAPDVYPWIDPSDTRYLLAGTTVSGTFLYDAFASYDGQSQDFQTTPGLSVYAGIYGSAPVLDLSGTVGGYSFADPRGLVALSNDKNFSDYGSNDFLTLQADAGAKDGESGFRYDQPRSLIGFTVGAYTLIDVRLFWIETFTGQSVDFLSSSQLPGQLPTLSGRLALDFIRTDDPYNTANVNIYSNTVFFDGLLVSAVPEPETYALMLAGLGLVGVVARRRTRKAISA